jgi:hypothetical protein
VFLEALRPEAAVVGQRQLVKSAKVITHEALGMRQ